MATYSITVQNSIRTIGPSPSWKWDKSTWDVSTWFDASESLPKIFYQWLQSNNISLGSLSFDFVLKRLSNQIGLDEDIYKEITKGISNDINLDVSGLFVDLIKNIVNSINISVDDKRIMIKAIFEGLTIDDPMDIFHQRSGWNYVYSDNDDAAEAINLH